MPPRLRCNYVNADLIYGEAECTPSQAIGLLEQIMQPEMTQKLRQDVQPGQATMPAYLLVATYPHGEATLNLYCQPTRWEHIWVLAKPRSKWLPILSKTVTTEPASANLQALSSTIAWACTASFDEVFQRLSAAQA